MRKLNAVLIALVIMFILSSCSNKKVKWGLSENERDEIRYDLDNEKQSALLEADEKYPIISGVTKEEIQKNDHYRVEILNKKRNSLAKKYNITTAILDSIEWEYAFEPMRK